jgi:hypothetical protein
MMEETLRQFVQDRANGVCEWNGSILIGKTQIGRVTINVLRINHTDAVAVRRALLDVGYRL